jgi:hypothetical protein
MTGSFNWGIFVGVLSGLLRFYSYLFAISLSLFTLGLCVVAVASGHPLSLGFLPWTGVRLIYWLCGLGLAGLLSVYLALRGRLRGVFFLWNLGVAGLLIWGFFLTPYTFTPAFPFKSAAWLAGGAFFAMIGAWPRSKRR